MLGFVTFGHMGATKYSQQKIGKMPELKNAGLWIGGATDA